MTTKTILFDVGSLVSDMTYLMFRDYARFHEKLQEVYPCKFSSEWHDEDDKDKDTVEKSLRHVSPPRFLRDRDSYLAIELRGKWKMSEIKEAQRALQQVFGDLDEELAWLDFVLLVE